MTVAGAACVFPSQTSQPLHPKHPSYKCQFSKLHLDIVQCVRQELGGAAERLRHCKAEALEVALARRARRRRHLLLASAYVSEKDSCTAQVACRLE